MSSVAPAVEPIAPARTSGLATTFDHARYVLGENRVTAFAFGLLIVILFAAMFGPYVVPHDPLASDTAAALKPPSSAHWFGTDQLGRDIFSRVIVATRLDIIIAVASVALVFLMGGLAGIAAGYFGGWTDRIIGRIADTIMAFPLFVLAMGIVAAPWPKVKRWASSANPAPASPSPPMRSCEFWTAPAGSPTGQ
jgi:peptide/nickel transport system permease protein